MHERFKFLLFCLLIVAVCNVQSQETDYSQQWGVQHDNDFLYGIDRYYTAGTFLQYGKLLQGDFIFKNKDDRPLQIDFKFGQETYTPRELFETDFNRLERPYAGYLFLEGAVSKGYATHIWKLQGELGLAGPQSLAGDAQVAYHELINEFIPVWSGEIANSIHVNFGAQYIKDFYIQHSNLLSYVSLGSKALLGTRRTSFKQEASLYFGNRATTSSTSAYGWIGSNSELYGVIRGGYEYVINNGLIEGHPLGDDSPFTLEQVASVWSIQAGLVYRSQRNTYSILHNYKTRETQREGPSQFVSLSFRRTF